MGKVELHPSPEIKVIALSEIHLTAFDLPLELANQDHHEKGPAAAEECFIESFLTLQDHLAAKKILPERRKGDQLDAL